MEENGNVKLYMNEIQLKKLKNLVSFAREHSEYYKKLYKDIPTEFDTIEILPITNKSELMSHFDEWVTDKKIKIDDIKIFIADQTLVGTKYLKKYHIAITSGTTGKNGVFVTDMNETKLSSKINKKSKFSWIGFPGFAKLMIKGIRIAAITAVGEHYGFISGIAYMKSENKFWGNRVKVFSIHDPVNEIVSELNKYNPTMIMGYASMISLLASEQLAGHLNISPVFIEVMSEKLTDNEFEKVGNVFNVKPYQMYGATEIPFASPLCEYGWYHMDTNYMILEPVDENGKHVSAGIMSHSLLITNLINKTQPMIRYNIGDCIMINPEKCKCGNSHPAFIVQGRTADSVYIVDESGEQVMIPSLMFVTLIDKFVQGVEAFQVLQTSPNVLEIRLQYPFGFEEEIKNRQWSMLRNELFKLLNDRGIKKITIERSNEIPLRSKGGKMRMVIPYGKN
jgi:phenylacetate-CoA ligase